MWNTCHKRSPIGLSIAYLTAPSTRWSYTHRSPATKVTYLNPVRGLRCSSLHAHSWKHVHTTDTACFKISTLSTPDKGVPAIRPWVEIPRRFDRLVIRVSLSLSSKDARLHVRIKNPPIFEGFFCLWIRMPNSPFKRTVSKKQITEKMVSYR